ncbi:F-box only protein 43 isoform X2 [Gadus morhua]|uniref:F-box only protein 43 isoform X2 n=1 Tax=Gadus morhua TaxID=8049 RepID=UPI0011B67C77|nr:F-box only protein 43 isoform X2 [Gadus morhua]
MDCTPDSGVQGFKKHPYHSSSFDSGYSDVQSFPGKTNGAKCAPCRYLSPEDNNETPKENLAVTPKKERTTETTRLSGNDSRRAQPPLEVGWCETPKTSKKDGLLRRRLIMGNAKSTTDAKTEVQTTPCTKVIEVSLRLGAKHHFSGSGIFSSSKSKSELDCRSPLSTRKRRLFYAQVKTSTHEYGRNTSDDHEGNVSLSSNTDLEERIGSFGHCATDQLGTPPFGKFLPALESESFQTPVNMMAASPGQSPCAQNTPSAALTPTYIRSLSEDSGFGSTVLDKSQDSSREHDGSFQELLLSSSGPRAGAEALHLSDGRRRSRLQRQQRLSTLREGGSQSEEDGRHVGQPHPGGKRLSVCYSPLKVDEVFLVSNTTPSGSSGLELGNRRTPLGMVAAIVDTATPLRTPMGKRDTAPCYSAAATAGRKATPLRNIPAGLEYLALTPALQLVRAMCLRKDSMTQDQIPSLELELRSAVALLESPVPIRTSMPLAGLIGRKMGVGRLDVLTELKNRNLWHILGVILNHLGPEDVHRFGQVCPSWDNIIGQDSRASSRRRRHLRDLEAALEQGGTVHVTDAETRLALTKRAVLGSIQSQSRSLSYCTPQSAKSTLTPSELNTSHSGGSSSSKREKFIQVAKTLFSDECLKPCPRCEHPAKCHPVKKEGVCSRADCSFQFCTGCLCEFHGGRECLSRSAGRHIRRDTVVPGSAQRKRNLRRL